MSKPIDKILQELVTARVQQRIVRYYRKHEKMPDIGKIIDEQYEAVYQPIIEHIDAMTVALKVSTEKFNETDK